MQAQNREKCKSRSPPWERRHFAGNLTLKALNVSRASDPQCLLSKYRNIGIVKFDFLPFQFNFNISIKINGMKRL